MGPIARHRLAALAALLIAGAGCGDDRDPAAAGAVDPGLAARLDALGYADWSEPGEGGDLARAGVVRFDRARAAPGLNFFEIRRSREARLMDLDGRTLHVWKAERAPQLGTRSWQNVHLLPNGDVVALSKHLYVERVDWRSNVLWRTPLAAHHDVSFDPPDGSGLLYTLARHESTLRRADGTGLPIYEDSIVLLDAGDGRILRRVSLLPFFADRIPDARLAAIARHADLAREALRGHDERREILQTRDVFHTNALSVLRRDLPGVARAGDLLLSLRELDLLAFLRLGADGTGEVVWTWGPGELSRQHQPTVLPSGHLLVFDNRPGEDDSRVVELDPVARRVVWEYRGDPPFSSHRRGGALRMANGNVLVAESEHGRAFEVTREGEIVWEYLNPEVDPANERRATFYRFYRLPPGYLAPGLLPAVDVAAP